MKLSDRCDLRDEGYDEGYKDGLAAHNAEVEELVEALEANLEGRVYAQKTVFDVSRLNGIMEALTKFKGVE